MLACLQETYKHVGNCGKLKKLCRKCWAMFDLLGKCWLKRRFLAGFFCTRPGMFWHQTGFVGTKPRKFGTGPGNFGTRPGNAKKNQTNSKKEAKKKQENQKKTKKNLENLVFLYVSQEFLENHTISQETPFPPVKLHQSLSPGRLAVPDPNLTSKTFKSFTPRRKLRKTYLGKVDLSGHPNFIGFPTKSQRF